MAGLDLNEPINWDEIGEFEGDIHDLTYDYVWDSGNEGNHREFSFLICFHCTSRELNTGNVADADDDNDEGEGNDNTANGEDGAVHGDVVVEVASSVQQAQVAPVPSVQQAQVVSSVQQVQVAPSVQQAQGAPSVQQADAGDEADAEDEADDVGAFDSGTPIHRMHALFSFSNEPKLSTCKP
jgi:hypothetical protein